MPLGDVQSDARTLLQTRIRYLDGTASRVQVLFQAWRDVDARSGAIRPGASVSVDREHARRMGPLIRDMCSADVRLRELTTQQARGTLGTGSDVSELMYQANRFLDLSARLAREWRAHPAFAYDTINASGWSRFMQQIVTRGTFEVGGGVARIPGAQTEPRDGPLVPWWGWMLGGAALLGVLYVGASVAIFAAKQTPQGRAVSMIAAPAARVAKSATSIVAKKAIEAGTKAAATTGEKLTAAAHLIKEKKE